MMSGRWNGWTAAQNEPMQTISFNDSVRVDSKDYGAVLAALGRLLDRAVPPLTGRGCEAVESVRARLRCWDEGAFVEVSKDEALSGMCELSEAAAGLREAGLVLEALVMEGAATRVMEALVEVRNLLSA